MSAAAAKDRETRAEDRGAAAESSIPSAGMRVFLRRLAATLSAPGDLYAARLAHSLFDTVRPDSVGFDVRCKASQVTGANSGEAPCEGGRRGL